MPTQAVKTALLLACSGLCAAVLHAVGFREVERVLGAGSAASATAWATLLGGLALGAAWLGRRADREPRSLELFAHLQLGVLTAAAATPGAGWLALQAGAGAPGLLGTPAGRMMSTALILGGPWVLLGGTLPAAARSVAAGHGAPRGVSRLGAALLPGAAAGVLLSRFLLLEVFGTRTTLGLACLLNAAVALLARGLARGLPQHPEVHPGFTVSGAKAPPLPAPPATRAGTRVPSAVVLGLVLALLGTAGGRLVTPLAGGTSAAGALLLAVALVGMGVGCAAAGARSPPSSPEGLAWTEALQAMAVALPLALVDRAAALALGQPGLGPALAAAALGFPAAVLAGVQLTLLVPPAPPTGVGVLVGRTAAGLAAGAVLGLAASHAGLLPALTAPGCWRLAGGLLAGMALVRAVRAGPTRSARLAAGVAGAALVLLAAAPGPSAGWRHGTGRAGELDRTVQGTRDGEHRAGRALLWEREGRESSVALRRDSGLELVVDGRVETHAVRNAPSAVMGGMLGALVHPRDVHRALVLGLGSGASAGWLGALPDVEQVDVVEAEPALVEAAGQFSALNHQVLRNPRVNIIQGDILASLRSVAGRYDVVLAAPSCLSRAGVTGQFTREFYREVRSRLEADGVFLQSLPAQGVDSTTARTVVATLVSVFPAVETWETQPGEVLLFVASARPIPVDLARLRERVDREPFRSALRLAWRVTDAEGVLAHHVAAPALAALVAAAEGTWLSTEDRRALDGLPGAAEHGTGMAEELADLAARAQLDRPVVRGDPDWQSVGRQRVTMFTAGGWARPPGSPAAPDLVERARAHQRFLAGDRAGLREAWRAGWLIPGDPTELAMLAEALADAGDPAAEAALVPLRAFHAAEADLVLAQLRTRQGRAEDAVAALESGFTALRTQVGAWVPLVQRSLDLAGEVAGGTDPARALRVLRALEEPWALELLHEERQARVVQLAQTLDPAGRCIRALEAWEPFPPWNRGALQARVACYGAAAHPRLAAARVDLAAFLAAEQPPVRLPARADTPVAP